MAREGDSNRRPQYDPSLCRRWERHSVCGLFQDSSIHTYDLCYGRDLLQHRQQGFPATKTTNNERLRSKGDEQCWAFFCLSAEVLDEVLQTSLPSDATRLYPSSFQDLI